MFKGLRVSRSTRLFTSSNVTPFQVFITNIKHSSLSRLSRLHSHTSKLISTDRCSRRLNAQYVCVDTRETGGYFSLRYLWLLEPDNLRKVNEQGWGGGGGLVRAHIWNSICPEAAPSPHLHCMFLYLMKFSKIGTSQNIHSLTASPALQRWFREWQSVARAMPWLSYGPLGLSRNNCPSPTPANPIRKDTRWMIVRQVDQLCHFIKNEATGWSWPPVSTPI